MSITDELRIIAEAHGKSLTELSELCSALAQDEDDGHDIGWNAQGEAGGGA